MTLPFRGLLQGEGGQHSRRRPRLRRPPERVSRAAQARLSVRWRVGHVELRELAPWLVSRVNT